MGVGSVVTPVNTAKGAARRRSGAALEAQRKGAFLLKPPMAKKYTHDMQAYVYY